MGTQHWDLRREEKITDSKTTYPPTAPQRASSHNQFHPHKPILSFACSILGNITILPYYIYLKHPTKVRLVKAMVFPVVIYGCESWTVKKAERRRIDAFELWCWRRLLRVPWTARRSNLCILNKISPECSWEGLMLKLKLQYFGHLMRRTDSLEKTLMLGCNNR